jgi:hypothetical protein
VLYDHFSPIINLATTPPIFVGKCCHLLDKFYLWDYSFHFHFQFLLHWHWQICSWT